MFTERFQLLLEKSGKTANQVAHDLSIPKSIVYEWKKGVREPSADKLIRLADYFGVSFAYLLGGEDPAPAQAEDESERELVLMLRAARKISPEDHDELIETFKKNIDLYLRAKGVDRSGNENGGHDPE